MLFGVTVLLYFLENPGVLKKPGFFEKTRVLLKNPGSLEKNPGSLEKTRVLLKNPGFRDYK